MPVPLVYRSGGVSRHMAERRPLRADARRNRERVLEVAIAAFAAEGLAVPVHEIARRAGVGTGTVSRHFPTKEALFQAIVLARIERCVHQADLLAATKPPGEAFFAFFAYLVAEGAVDHGLADALVGAGFDIEAAASRSQHDVMGAIRGLLAAAQQAGDVRADVDTADVKALMAGCLARGRAAEGGMDSTARDRLVAVIRAGLRPPPPE
jgi:AcrR family transcriptional regulator